MVLAQGVPAAVLRQSSLMMHLCWCFKVTRADGTAYYFTSHDATVRRLSYPRTNSSTLQYYFPHPILPSASRHETGLASMTSELRGATGASGGFEFGDLRAGLFDEAEVERQLVDWRFPWVNPQRFDRFFVARTEYDEDTWALELEGWTSKLKRKAGDIYQRRCDNELGDNRCTKNISVYPFTVSGAQVTDVQDRTTFTLTKAGGSGFSPATHVTDYFALGYVSFTNLANAGLVELVASNVVADGSGNLQVTLLRPTRFPIDTNHIVDIVVGCDKQHPTCRDKFNNLIHYRGCPHIPGFDKAIHSASTN